MQRRLDAVRAEQFGEIIKLRFIFTNIAIEYGILLLPLYLLFVIKKLDKLMHELLDKISLFKY